MANRQTLHRSKLDEFRSWLQVDGWEIEDPKGEFEVIRARKGKKLLLIYDRLSGSHFSYAETANGVVNAFLKAKKRERSDNK